MKFYKDYGFDTPETLSYKQQSRLTEARTVLDNAAAEYARVLHSLGYADNVFEEDMQEVTAWATGKQ